MAEFSLGTTLADLPTVETVGGLGVRIVYLLPLLSSK
jgi:hypothetical protein